MRMQRLQISGQAQVCLRIWPISVSQSLPQSVQIDGFDISEAQFLPTEWLPANVSLTTLNILESIPEHLVGRYDVVHIRYFGLLIRNGNHRGVLNNLTSLLKPGGSLQWVEVDIARQRVVSARQDIVTKASRSLCEDSLNFLSSSGLSYDWLHELPSSFKDVGLTEVKESKPKPKPEFRSIFGFGAITGWEEFSHEVLDKHGPNEILGSGPELRTRIEEVRAEFQKGVSFEQQLHVVIGRRLL